MRLKKIKIQICQKKLIDLNVQYKITDFNFSQHETHFYSLSLFEVAQNEI